MTYPVGGPSKNLAQRLWVVYSLERAADQATMPVSFAIVTVAITYAATTIAVTINYTGTLPHLVRALIPLVMVGLYTAIAGLDASSQVRGHYMDELEQRLNELHRADPECPIGNQEVPAPGLRQLISRLEPRAKKSSRSRTVISTATHPYLLAAVFILIYIFFILFRDGPIRWPEWTAFVIYAAMMGWNTMIILRAPSRSFYERQRARMSIEVMEDVEPSEPPNGSEP
jgi:hypothetical protein